MPNTPPTNTTLEDVEWVRPITLHRRWGINRKKFAWLADQPGFPPALVLGPQSQRFRADQIADWEAAGGLAALDSDERRSPVPADVLGEPRPTGPRAKRRTARTEQEAA